MRCPYCNTDYTHDHPCFCHPPAQAKPVEDQPASFPETFPSIAWNSHRGVRLDSEQESVVSSQGLGRSVFGIRRISQWLMANSLFFTTPLGP